MFPKTENIFVRDMFYCSQVWRKMFSPVLLFKMLTSIILLFRSIVSSRGSVTYGVAKELARILKPLVGRTLLTPPTDGTFTTGVYKKHNHTDLYLQWDRHHNLASKYSVINTLTHKDQSSVLYPLTTWRRITTFRRGPDKMQIS